MPCHDAFAGARGAGIDAAGIARNAGAGWHYLRPLAPPIIGLQYGCGAYREFRERDLSAAVFCLLDIGQQARALAQFGDISPLRLVIFCLLDIGQQACALA
jgi:hypothetical protein